MHCVGIRELKNRLSYYLKLTQQGHNIVVTERGRPTAILHAIGAVEETADLEERLLSLAVKGMMRLPVRKLRKSKSAPARVKGAPLSKMIIEERR